MREIHQIADEDIKQYDKMVDSHQALKIIRGDIDIMNIKTE